MNKKVEELVEWVAKTIYADWGCSKWENLMDTEKEMWLNTTKDALSHPDLALIVDDSTGHIVVRGNTIFCYPVIPLAEALKEKK